MRAALFVAKDRPRVPLTLPILAAVFFCVGPYLGGLQAQTSADHRHIERLIAKYVRSIDAADTTLAAQVWSQSPDVSFIHPRGHEHGFGEVRQNFYVRTMGDTFSERKLTTKDIRIHVYGDAAWAEFYWDFEATLKKDGSSINTKGRETQVYQKEQGVWRLVHVHYSGMPVSGGAPRVLSAR